MGLTGSRYAQLYPLLPVRRSAVKIDGRRGRDALPCIVENGCEWRRLPKEYGRAIECGFAGGRSRVFLIGSSGRCGAGARSSSALTGLGLNGAGVTAPPDAMGARKKEGRGPLANPGADGTPKIVWLPQMIERRRRSARPPAGPATA